jgi:hypothetical protein
MFELGEKIQEAKLRLQMGLSQIIKDAGVDPSFLDDLMWGGKPQQLPEGTTYEEACKRVATTLKLDPEEFWKQAQNLPDVRPEPFGVSVATAVHRLRLYAMQNHGKARQGSQQDPKVEEVAEQLKRCVENLFGYRYGSLR